MDTQQEMPFFLIIADFLERGQERIELLEKEKLITLKHIGITSKTFADWKKKDLIPFYIPKENRYWVRLSLSDYVWLKLLAILRDFGVSFQSLQEIKNFWLKDNDFVRVDEKGKAVLVNSILGMVMDLGISVALDNNLDPQEMVHEAFEEGFKYVQIENMRIPLLTRFLHHASHYNYEGRFLFFNHSLIPDLKGFDFEGRYTFNLENENFISISLRSIIDEFVRNEKIPRTNKLKMLGEKELKILEELRFIETNLNTKEKKGHFSPVSNIPVTANLNEECKKYPHQKIIIDIQDYKRMKITRIIK